MVRLARLLAVFILAAGILVVGNRPPRATAVRAVAGAATVAPPIIDLDAVVAQADEIQHRQLVQYLDGVAAQRRSEAAAAAQRAAAARQHVRAASAAPAQPSAPAPARASTGVNWSLMADCESGAHRKDGSPIPGTANWHINSGNGYSGGLQWAASTWSSVRASSDPTQAWQASASQQIAAAERLLARGGSLRGQWPVCSKYA